MAPGVDAVRDGARAWVRSHVAGAADADFDGALTPATAGMTTFIWFAQLAGRDLPPPWREPIVLRVFPDASDDLVARREGEVMAFVAAHGYPVPAPLAVVPVGPDNPLGVPWTVLPRAPGHTMLEWFKTSPWSARRLLRDLAELQVRLHRIPTDNVPLPDHAPLVDQWFERYSAVVEAHAGGDPLARRVLDALHDRRALVADEDRVICHGDFHPLNTLTERDGVHRAAWRHQIIDWTDVMLGDRHYDVARTVALFGAVRLAATKPLERLLLGGFGPVAAGIYRRAYAAQLPVDPKRFSYWTAAHLLRGWAQVRGLDTPTQPRTLAADAVPVEFATTLLRRSARAIDRAA
jgi:aminoglycoside phosphotransferase (APT) family kinase protein